MEHIHFWRHKSYTKKIQNETNMQDYNKNNYLIKLPH